MILVLSTGLNFNFQNIFACHDHLQIFEESNLNRGIEVKSVILAKRFTSPYEGATLTSASIYGSETAVLTMLLGAVVLSASAKLFKVSNSINLLAKGCTFFRYQNQWLLLFTSVTKSSCIKV